MIAVVYSGSRYSNWRLTEKKEVIEVRTNGINPFFNDEKWIIQLLNKNTKLINNAEAIKKIYFFGAGASSKERNLIIHNALSKFFRYSKVYVSHDMDAAAKASSDDKPGVVCIIGSGSNASFFDGKKIIENSYGLGYAISDEGSATWMGKAILKAYLSDTMPADIKAAFEKKYDYDRRTIMDKLYKLPHPNIFLTSFTSFYNENRTSPYIKGLIKEGFGLFMDTYLIPLHQSYGGKHPIYFVGTIAAFFQDYLREVAEEKNINISSVIKEPIYNLLNYYANKN
ncbi:hypothetical protein [Pedobacter alpinus]|uniref:N-acetylglucosamine kinase n=1 Tax=Pedobacter alpinus TaxID=1590643 RepID=A0ABW5TTU7_9SPHI